MDLRSSLLEQLETVDGEALEPHFKREALIFVSQSLNIVDVGVAFANDNKETVASWLQNGDIWKCTPNDEQQGALSSEKSYEFLILQPFVLAKLVDTPLQ